MMVWVSLNHLSLLTCVEFVSLHSQPEAESLKTWMPMTLSLSVSGRTWNDLRMQLPRKLIVPGSIFLCPRVKSLFCSSVAGIRHTVVISKQMQNGFGQKFSFFLYCPCSSLCAVVGRICCFRASEMHTFSFKSGVPVPDHLEQCVPQSMGCECSMGFLFGHVWVENAWSPLTKAQQHGQFTHTTLWSLFSVGGNPDSIRVPASCIRIWMLTRVFSHLYFPVLKSGTTVFFDGMSHTVYVQLG